MSRTGPGTLADVQVAGEAAGRRTAERGVLVLAALLPVLELGRVVLAEPGAAGRVAAVVLTLLALPLHLRHVHAALQGRRAAHVGWSLTALAALLGLGLVLVETTWGFLLGSFAVSVLLVLRLRWAVPAFGAVLVLASIESSALYTDGVPASARLYLVLVVAFRATCLYVVIRLLAHLRVLDAARGNVARSAVERQRSRTALHLTRSLGPDLEQVGRRAAALPGPEDVRAAQAEVAALAQEARRVMADVRRIVATTRDHTSQQAISDAGRLLRGDDVGPPPVRSRPPAAGVRGTTVGPLLLLVLVRILVVGILLFFVLGVGVDLRLPAWCAGVAVAVALLEAVLSLRTALATPSAPLRRDRVVAAVTATAVLATLAVLPNPAPFLLTLAYVSSAAVQVLPGRWRWGAVVGTLLVLALAASRQVVGALTPGELLWYLLAYLPTTHLLAVGALLASARLLGAVTRLEPTRVLLAETAVVAENRRFARDLHDVLVQRLSAIALTADLVHRLLTRDAGAAAREMDGLRRLAEGLADDARRVGRGERDVTLAEETRTASQLLRAAGIDTDIRVRAAPGSPAADTLLGWAVREAATNVVRHSAATRCLVEVTPHETGVRLLVVNDGAQHPRAGGPGGSGLAGLRDRAEALGGSVRTDLDPTGEFRLAVTVPGASETAGALGGPEGVDPVARTGLRDRRREVVPHRRR